MVTLLRQVQGSQPQVVSQGQLGPSVHQNSDVGLVPVLSCHVEGGAPLPTGSAWGVQISSSLLKNVGHVCCQNV